jgi:hypothetical protein
MGKESRGVDRHDGISGVRMKGTAGAKSGASSRAYYMRRALIMSAVDAVDASLGSSY